MESRILIHQTYKLLVFYRALAARTLKISALITLTKKADSFESAFLVSLIKKLLHPIKPACLFGGIISALHSQLEFF
jgi:hypothetical protein